MKWIFIVFCLYLVSLCFRQERLPSGFCEAVIARFAPTNLVVRCESVSFGFIHGIYVRGIKIYDTAKKDPLAALAAADSVAVDPLRFKVRVVGAKYPRLPDSYYAPGNSSVERGDEAFAFNFPDLPHFRLTLVRPDILAIRPESVECNVDVSSRRVDFSDVDIEWPDLDRKICLDGRCLIDLDKKRLTATVEGHATQAHIRPFIETLDVPVALPYMDAFTDIPEPVKAKGLFEVDLRNNDFTMTLDLKPVMGSYNAVPMKRAEGRLKLFVYTRNDRLNYTVKVADLSAVDIADRKMSGELTVRGVNDLLTVDLNAESELPIQDFIYIAGFPDVDAGAKTGQLSGHAHFEMYEPDTSDLTRFNGYGKVEVKKGHLSQMKLFMGLTDHLARHVPGIASIVNQSTGRCDFTITNGVFRSKNISIGGNLFTLAMNGEYDIVNDKLDFRARVKLMKDENLLGKLLIRPVTWTFSKLLMEFRLVGTADSPHWEYISVIDRVMEAIK
jgi:hypothetical protein